MTILYPKVTNRYWFLLSLETVQKYIKNILNIFVLRSNIDLSDITNIQLVNQTFHQFCSRQDVSLKFMVIDLNVCLLQDINPEYLPITYTIINNQYIQDHVKPQVILKSKYLLLPNVLFLYPLSLYYKHLNRIGIPDTSYTVIVNKPICCTIKSLLSIKSFAIFNEQSFDSMKKFMLKKLYSLF